MTGAVRGVVGDRGQAPLRRAGARTSPTSVRSSARSMRLPRRLLVRTPVYRGATWARSACACVCVCGGGGEGGAPCPQSSQCRFMHAAAAPSVQKEEIKT